MDFTIYAIGLIATMAIFVAGQELLLFECGILSLGSPAFFACGAYVSALLAKDAGLPVGVSIALGSLAGTILALGVGYPWLRALRSDFFAVATLALGQAAVAVLRVVGPGGLAGMAGVPRLPALSRHMPGSRSGAMIAGIAAILVIAALDWLRGRRIGLAMVSVRTDENGAAADGIRPLLVKLQAFLLSSGLAAFAGATQAHLLGVIDPRMASLDMTVLVLVATIVSGTCGSMGPLIGASFAVLLPELLQRLLLQNANPHWQLFPASRGLYGILLIALASFVPWLRRLGTQGSVHA